ncbi:hypothetical protein L873DRAFT_806143 [Choiromyces venosus 120613-1]|uniref:Uncharacterized protein n=1 Tax=Choiromyces venosus 120613-1 TaxID=1336337 RepID=A0A3N4K7W4_9PEZI|nr:hypothetical protein L873DRAFT_806143 [Choiromyces venosus 120613-1]
MIQAPYLLLPNSLPSSEENQIPESVDRPQQEIILLLQQVNSRLDSMESRLTTFEKCLYQVKSQLVVPQRDRRSILHENQVQKTYSTLKEFVDAPSILAREVDTFKEENSHIRVFVKSLFLCLDLKSPDLFDRNKLLLFLIKNGTSGVDSSVFVTKKSDVLRVLSECLTEEKSKFKSALRNASSRFLPIESFTQHLFHLKAYVTASESKKEKMKLVAAKWRYVTEEIWTSSLSPRKCTSSTITIIG